MKNLAIATAAFAETITSRMRSFAARRPGMLIPASALPTTPVPDMPDGASASGRRPSRSRTRTKTSSGLRQGVGVSCCCPLAVFPGAAPACCCPFAVVCMEGILAEQPIREASRPVLGNSDRKPGDPCRCRGRWPCRARGRRCRRNRRRAADRPCRRSPRRSVSES